MAKKITNSENPTQIKFTSLPHAPHPRRLRQPEKHASAHGDNMPTEFPWHTSVLTCTLFRLNSARVQRRHFARAGWYQLVHDWHYRVSAVPVRRMVPTRSRPELPFGLQLPNCSGTQTYFLPQASFFLTQHCRTKGKSLCHSIGAFNRIIGVHRCISPCPVSKS